MNRLMPGRRRCSRSWATPRARARIGAYRPRSGLVAAPLRNGIGRSRPADWQGGNRGTAEIELHQVNDEWRVVAFRFN